MPPILRTSVVLPVILSIASGEIAARDLGPGQSYTSRFKLFAMTAPQVCSSLPLQYDVKESAKTGNEFVEEAGFHIADVGELYRVGVRRLTRQMRQQVEQADGVLPPTALAWLALNLHLADRAKRTGEWRPASDFETPETQFGRAVMSVNHVEGGRFIRQTTFDSNTRKFVPIADRPAEVVVLVVQSGAHLLYVTGQADLGSIDCVQREAWKVLEGLKLSRSLNDLP